MFVRLTTSPTDWSCPCRYGSIRTCQNERNGHNPFNIALSYQIFDSPPQSYCSLLPTHHGRHRFHPKPPERTCRFGHCSRRREYTIRMVHEPWACRSSYFTVALVCRSSVPHIATQLRLPCAPATCITDLPNQERSCTRKSWIKCAYVLLQHSTIAVGPSDD
jgi:hypothetical protein